MANGLTYKSSGVDYSALDPFKIAAQAAAMTTDSNCEHLEVQVYEPSRGESAFLFQNGDHYLAHVEEGLGTKNLVADALATSHLQSWYHSIAIDTVAMIVNDMITVGAFPIGVAMHLAVGDSAWFDDKERTQQLIDGWRYACDRAMCTWTGGETPTLKGIVEPGTAVLSGSAIGKTIDMTIIDPARIQAGDAIIICESSGIHANGLTLARKIAEMLPEGYRHDLSNKKTFGESLLVPTHIYVPLIYKCLAAGLVPHYAINITGHGWRKLMRARQDFSYVIDTLPVEQPLFSFLQEHGKLSDEEAYGNLNMGAGFALIVARKDVDDILQIVSNSPTLYRVFVAGRIEPGEKRVVIEPKGIEFKAATLAVR